LVSVPTTTLKHRKTVEPSLAVRTGVYTVFADYLTLAAVVLIMFLSARTLF
jgi:hypothetical protein